MDPQIHPRPNEVPTFRGRRKRLAA